MYRYAIVVPAMLLMACLAAGCSGNRPENTDKAVMSDGKALVEERCSSCHSTDRIYGHKHTEEEWEHLVEYMLRKGAKLDPDEQKTVLKYLSNR